MHRYYITRTVFRVVLADNDEEALEKARKGNWNEWSFTTGGDPTYAIIEKEPACPQCFDVIDSDNHVCRWKKGHTT